jgi:hypothetical protein
VSISGFVEERASAQVGLAATGVLNDPNACWIEETTIETGGRFVSFGGQFKQIGGILSPPNPTLNSYAGGVYHSGRGATFIYFPSPTGSFRDSTHRLRRVPCPPGLGAPAFASTFTGLSVGGSVGSVSFNNGVLNVLQDSLCFTLFCTPDMTPNPFATFSGNGTTGSVFLEYNQQLGPLFILNPAIVGIKASANLGSNTATMPGFPGQTGIGSIGPVGPTNSSTTVKIGEGFDLLGKIGTILLVGQTPVYIGVEGGGGWRYLDLTENCNDICTGNGLPASTFHASKTVPGFVWGVEVAAPLRSFPFLGQPLTQGLPLIQRATIGFEATFYDGNATVVLGTPPLIQTTVHDHVRETSLVGTLKVPLSGPQPFQSEGLSGFNIRF